MKAIMGVKKSYISSETMERFVRQTAEYSMYIVCFLSQCVRNGCVFHFSLLLGQPFSLHLEGFT